MRSVDGAVAKAVLSLTFEFATEVQFVSLYRVFLFLSDYFSSGFETPLDFAALFVVYAQRVCVSRPLVSNPHLILGVALLIDKMWLDFDYLFEMLVDWYKCDHRVMVACVRTCWCALRGELWVERDAVVQSKCLLAQRHAELLARGASLLPPLPLYMPVDDMLVSAVRRLSEAVPLPESATSPCCSP